MKRLASGYSKDGHSRRESVLKRVLGSQEIDHSGEQEEVEESVWSMPKFLSAIQRGINRMEALTKVAPFEPVLFRPEFPVRIMEGWFMLMISVSFKVTRAASPVTDAAFL